jgi:hypothetical protein
MAEARSSIMIHVERATDCDRWEPWLSEIVWRGNLASDSFLTRRLLRAPALKKPEVNVADMAQSAERLSESSRRHRRRGEAKQSDVIRRICDGA